MSLLLSMALMGVVFAGLAALLVLTTAALVLALGPMLRASAERERQRAEASDAAWAKVAAHHDWSHRPDAVRVWHGVTTSGAPVEAGGLRRYHSNGKGGGYYEYWIEVRVCGVAPPGHIMRQGMFQFAPEKEVGAPAFDDMAYVRVPDEHLPRFGHRFQAAFLQALRWGHKPYVDDGDVIARLDGRYVTVDAVEGLVQAAEAMAAGIHTEPMPVLLAAELREAQAPVYRVRCLRQLAELDPPRARAEALPLLACGVAPLELEAAVQVGAHDAVVAHLEADPSPSSADALRALYAVVWDLPDERVPRALMAAARGLTPTHLRELYEALERRPRLGATQGLIDSEPVLDTRAAGWRVAGAAWCRALAAQSDGGEGESLLAGRLHQAEEDVAVAAAVALRAVGTAASVPALKAAASEVGLFQGGRTAAACQQAIVAIQGRATGGAGDLSLAASAPERGGLSEVEPSTTARSHRPRRGVSEGS